MAVSPITSGDTMMLADVSMIVDEKKTSDDEDERYATASALAAEALRLAEEAKRAAERLAEVRATILYLQQQNKPRPQSPQQPLSLDIKVEDTLTVDVQVEEEKSECEKNDTILEALVTPQTATSPVASIPSPVSILKTSTSKSEPKEVRYAPDTVDPVVSTSKKAQVLDGAQSPAEETNLIVKFYDAVGIDKICGLEFDQVEIEQQAPVPNKTKRVFVAPKLAMQADPFEAGSIGVMDNVDQSDAAIHKRKEETSPTPAISEEKVGKPAAVTCNVKSETDITSVPAVEEAKLQTNHDVKAETKVVAGDSTTSRAKLDPPSNLVKKEISSPIAEGSVDQIADQKTSEVAESREEHVTEVPKDSQPVALDVPVAPVKEPHHMSSLMKQVLARKKAPILAKPDPFGGEHDDMDFIPCGSNEPAYPQNDDDLEGNLASPRMICGWGA